MRDILTDFGTATTVASTAADFAYGIDAGEGGNIGRICPLFVHFIVEGSTAVGAEEEITFTVLHKEDSGAGEALMEWHRPAGALAVGEGGSFKLPADHERCLTLSVTAETAGIVLHAWLEEGEIK